MARIFRCLYPDAVQRQAVTASGRPLNEKGFIVKERPFAPLTDRVLLRKLVITVVIKFVLLFGLWWLFIRGHGVFVDSEVMAQQATSSVEPMQKNQRGGNPNHGH